MAQQTINLGTANAGNGDPLRTGGDKINDNFTELYAAAAGGGISIPVPQTRTSINLLNQNDAGWITGQEIPLGASDPNLALIADANKSTSQLIPIIDGDWLRRVNLDTYRFLRSDGTTVVPFTDPVYGSPANNRRNSIKIVFDDPADDIAYIQVTMNTSNIAVTDMLVHFRDCDTSGNPVVVPTGWEDYSIFTPDYDQYDVDLRHKERLDGLNMFDPTVGYYAGGYDQNGNFGQSFPSSGLLPALPNEPYCYVEDITDLNNTTRNGAVSFYDSGGTFLSGTIGRTAISPANTAFVSIRFPSNTINYYNVGVFNSDAPISNVNRYRYRTIGVADVMDIKWNVIGDSTSSEHYENDAAAYALEAYPTLTRKALNIPVMRNYAADGQQFEDFADDLSFYNTDCDVCTIMLGTNDWSFNKAIGTIADSAYQATPASYPNTLFGKMGKLYHGILDLNVDVVIGFILPIHRTGEDTPNTQSETLEGYVNYIIEFCTYYGIPFLNGYTDTNISAKNPDQLATYYVAADGIHPTSAAHQQFIAPKVIEFVKSLGPQLT